MALCKTNQGYGVVQRTPPAVTANLHFDSVVCVLNDLTYRVSCMKLPLVFKTRVALMKLSEYSVWKAISLLLVERAMSFMFVQF